MTKLVSLTDKVVHDLDLIRSWYSCSYSEAIKKLLVETDFVDRRKIGLGIPQRLREITDDVRQACPSAIDVKSPLGVSLAELMRQGAIVLKNIPQKKIDG